VRTAYESFLRVLTGLDGSPDRTWVAALSQVATPAVAASVAAAATTIGAAHEHTVGQLTDAQFTVAVTGSQAQVGDCLDEYDWHLVENGSGAADPGVTRGRFRGEAQLTETGGRWLIAQFHSTTTPC
jgi:hypothetical protein